MKTIGDLERWLKGAGNGYNVKLLFNGKQMRCDYSKPGAEGIWFTGPASATLEGALENAMEELRRKENGAESVREENPFEVVTKAVVTARTSMNRWLLATPVVPPNAPAPGPVAYPTCVVCGDFPNNAAVGHGGSTLMCLCGNVWNYPIIQGTVIRHNMGNGKIQDMEWTGNRWRTI